MTASTHHDEIADYPASGPSKATVRKRRLIGLVIAFLVFALDQWFKSYVVNDLNLRETGPIEVTSFFDLRWAQNFGVSYSMLTAGSTEMRWLLVGITGLIAMGVTIWMLRERTMGEILPLALILGGALGNIRDRYRLGYVIDYADLHFDNFNPFGIFNIADAAISVGVVLLLLHALFVRKDQPKPQQSAEPAAENENA